MVNGNQSKLLGLGAVEGLGMEENERENVPLISVKTDPRPADTVAAVASKQRQQADISERARGLMFRDLFTKTRLFLLDKREKRI